MLRAVRLALGPEVCDAGGEAEAWDELSRKHPVAGTLDPDFAKELQEEFEKEDAALRQRVLAHQCAWRRDVAREIWFDEIINLSAESQALLPNPEDAAEARKFFAFAKAISGLPEKGARMATWLAENVAPRANEAPGPRGNSRRRSIR